MIWWVSEWVSRHSPLFLPQHDEKKIRPVDWNPCALTNLALVTCIIPGAEMPCLIRYQIRSEEEEERTLSSFPASRCAPPLRVGFLWLSVVTEARPETDVSTDNELGALKCLPLVTWEAPRRRWRLWRQCHVSRGSERAVVAAVPSCVGSDLFAGILGGGD